MYQEKYFSTTITTDRREPAKTYFSTTTCTTIVRHEPAKNKTSIISIYYKLSISFTGLQFVFKCLKYDLTFGHFKNTTFNANTVASIFLLLIPNSEILHINC